MSMLDNAGAPTFAGWSEDEARRRVASLLRCGRAARQLALTFGVDLEEIDRLAAESTAIGASAVTSANACTERAARGSPLRGAHTLIGRRHRRQPGYDDSNVRTGHPPRQRRKSTPMLFTFPAGRIATEKPQFLYEKYALPG
jgi:hypothetical protein